MLHSDNSPFEIKKIPLSNGCNIAYIDEGAGEKTILFIHGLATYAQSWKKNIEGLKGKYRCVALDLPGNGYSDRGDYKYSIDFFSGAVYDFILKLGLKNIAIVGHSMGGQIAVTLLKFQPECGNELILCAPAGFETFNALEKSLYHATLKVADMFSSEENSLRETIRNSFYHHNRQADDMINELVAILKKYPLKQYHQMLDGCIAGMLNEPVIDILPLIKQRCLVIFGDRDALIPNKLIHPVSTKRIGEEGVKRMPNAVLEMIPSCGHFVQWEKAEEVNNEIDRFLSKK